MPIRKRSTQGISITALKAERDYLFDLATKFDEIIQFLENTASDELEDSTKTSYQRRAPFVASFTTRRTVIERILEILRENNTPMTRKEIEMKAEKNGEPFTGNIITAMSMEKDKADTELVLHKEGMNSYWALKSWFNKDGTLMTEHQSIF